jgi:hypothetical protein
MSEWTNPSGREVKDVGLRPLAFCDCGFESSRENECVSRLNVALCQVKMSATSRHLALLSVVCPNVIWKPHQ